jgi:hypothetical protein
MNSINSYRNSGLKGSNRCLCPKCKTSILGPSVWTLLRTGGGYWLFGGSFNCYNIIHFYDELTSLTPYYGHTHRLLAELFRQHSAILCLAWLHHFLLGSGLLNPLDESSMAGSVLSSSDWLEEQRETDVRHLNINTNSKWGNSLLCLSLQVGLTTEDTTSFMGIRDQGQVKPTHVLSALKVNRN